MMRADIGCTFKETQVRSWEWEEWGGIDRMEREGKYWGFSDSGTPEWSFISAHSRGTLGTGYLKGESGSTKKNINTTNKK